jgi:uncharacterized protein with HEPN domain
MTDEKSAKEFGRKEYEYLCDIREAIEEIESHPRFGEGKNAWDEDKYYRGWCYLQLARIGEAAIFLCKPEFGDYQQKYPDMPWKQIKGMRTILVHVYWVIDNEIGWTAVQKLPELKNRISQWIGERKAESVHDISETRATSKLKELLSKNKADEEKDHSD